MFAQFILLHVSVAARAHKLQAMDHQVSDIRGFEVFRQPNAVPEGRPEPSVAMIEGLEGLIGARELTPKQRGGSSPSYWSSHH